jgi:hypothetical protein
MSYMRHLDHIVDLQKMIHQVERIEPHKRDPPHVAFIGCILLTNATRGWYGASLGGPTTCKRYIL